MKTILRRVGLTWAFALALLLLAEGSAHAQSPRPGGLRPIVVPPPPAPVTLNPYTLLPNGMTLGQYASNVSVLANAYGQIPPWLLGYNPYPNPVISLGPTYVPPPYTPPVYTTPVVNPYALPNFYTNPYFSFFRTFP